MACKNVFYLSALDVPDINLVASAPSDLISRLIESYASCDSWLWFKSVQGYTSCSIPYGGTTITGTNYKEAIIAESYIANARIYLLQRSDLLARRYVPYCYRIAIYNHMLPIWCK